MERFNKEDINKYLNGEFIENEEELEKDRDFMLSAIIISNDKNMYNLCSDDLKGDYYFIKSLIIKFANDTDFICKVADDYLKRTDNEINAAELIIIMCNLTKGKNTEKYKEYHVIEALHYQFLRHEIALAKEAIGNNKDEKDSSGMDFSLIFDIYKDNEIALYFYIDKLIESTFFENNLDLEKLIHNKFNNFEELEKKGVNTFILEIISNYDQDFSSYLSAHIKLLSNIKKEIEKIKNNWEFYKEKEEIKEKYNYKYIFELARQYIEEAAGDPSSTDKLVYYVGKKLGIVDKLKKYDHHYSKDFENFLDEMGEYNFFHEYDYEENVINGIKDNSDLSFEDQRHIKNIEKIITKVLEAESNEELENILYDVLHGKNKKNK